MIFKGFLDTNEYKQMHLKNGIDVVLVNNSNYRQCSCSLSVAVGSYSDPHKYLGMAHLLEHVLFSGTHEYPGKTQFLDFVNTNGGYTNAFTHEYQTVFGCAIDYIHFWTMIKMFASFFKTPLFNKEAIDIEIGRIEDEYLSKKNNVSYITFNILNEIVNYGERRWAFSCGNRETLQRDGIYTAVKEFWEKEYSCKKMKLVLCGNSGFEELELLAREFEDIGEGKKGSQEINISVPSLHYRKFYGRLIRINDRREKNELAIFVDVDNTYSQFKKNPFETIEDFFTAKSPGSLYCCLNENGLATDVLMIHSDCFLNTHMDTSWKKSNPFVENGVYKIENQEFNNSVNAKCKGNSFKGFTHVKISIILTEKGEANLPVVIRMLCSAFKSMKISAEDYAFIGSRRQLNYNSLVFIDAYNHAVNISMAMHKYPIENVLNYDCLFEEYDGNLINELIGILANTDNWIPVLYTRMGPFCLIDKYYKAFYSIEYNVKPDPTCQIFDRSTWCKAEPNDINIIKYGNSQFQSQRVFDSGVLTYVFDSSYNEPIAIAHILLSSNEFTDNYAMIKIYMEMAIFTFTMNYALELYKGKGNISAKMNQYGVYINVSSYGSHMAQLCTLFIKHLYSLSVKENVNLFNKVKNGELWDEEEDIFAQANEKLVYKLLNVDIKKTNSEAISKVNFNDLFFPIFYYSNVSIIGNITIEDAFKVYDSVAVRSYKICAPELHLQMEEKIVLEVAQMGESGVVMLYKVAKLYKGLTKEVFKEMAIGGFVYEIASYLIFLKVNDLKNKVIVYETLLVNRCNYISFFIYGDAPIDTLKNELNEIIKWIEAEIRKLSDEFFQQLKRHVIDKHHRKDDNLAEFANNLVRKNPTKIPDLTFKRKFIEAILIVTKNDIVKNRIFDTHSELYIN